jgi:hypothetical protein
MKRFLLMFMRYSLEIDRYLAERSGNRAMRIDSVNRISAIDRQIDLMDIGELR